jgi:hypothetical protein
VQKKFNKKFNLIEKKKKKKDTASSLVQRFLAPRPSKGMKVKKKQREIWPEDGPYIYTHTHTAPLKIYSSGRSEWGRGAEAVH